VSGGKPDRIPTGTQLRGEAERQLAEKLGEKAKGAPIASRARITVSQLLDLVVCDYKARKLRSVEDLKWRIEGIRDRTGKIRAAKYGTDHIQAYIAQRQGDRMADSTINRELAIVRRGFNLAYKHEPRLIDRVPTFNLIELDNTRQGFLEHEQYRTLLAELPDRLKVLFVVGFHLGTRLGTLRRMKWPQVDFVNREIRIEKKQSKGKMPHTLPIYGEMETWLKWQRERLDVSFPGCPWVFHYLGQKPIGAHLKGWSEACDRAGLPGLLFHDLRRTAVRNMERAGIPRKVAMQITGHKTESVYLRYDIVSARDLKIAAAKMEEFLGHNLGTSAQIEPLKGNRAH
jgi:integrase